MIDYYEPKLDLTLLGCGFLGSYYMGAICLLEKIWPQKPYNRICGASSGGLLGALLISGLKLDYVLEVSIAVLRQLRAHYTRLLSSLANNCIVGRHSNSPTRQATNNNASTTTRADLDALLMSDPDANKAARDKVETTTTTTKITPRAQAALLPTKAQKRLNSDTGFQLLLPVRRLVEQLLDRMLPDDAHLRCSGRLGVSVTRLSWPLENVVFSEFNTRNELIAATSAGCFIPVWSGSLWAPKIHGQYYIDGAYSNNQPKFPDVQASKNGHSDKRFILGKSIKQASLSPFCCDIQVSPRDKDSMKLFSYLVANTRYICTWRNVVRCWHAMLPQKLSTYKQYVKSGHEEMKEYLFRENMLKCRQCYEQLIAQANDKGHKNQSKDLNSAHNGGDEACDNTKIMPCLHCLKLFERVDSLKVSDEMLRLMDDE